MDWPQDMQTDLWAFPRGIARNGLGPGAGGITWTSKYGSVAASVYGLGTGDGLNEKGLVVNVLWLTEADYGKRHPRQPGLARICGQCCTSSTPTQGRSSSTSKASASRWSSG